MAKTTIFLMVLCAAVSVTAQTTTQSQATNQRHSKKAKDEITVRGCVSTLSLDYILIQPDQGNTYELQGSRKVRLGP